MASGILPDFVKLIGLAITATGLWFYALWLRLSCVSKSIRIAIKNVRIGLLRMQNESLRNHNQHLKQFTARQEEFIATFELELEGIRLRKERGVLPTEEDERCLDALLAEWHQYQAAAALPRIHVFAAHLLLPKQHREDMLGDLEEEFPHFVQKFGEQHAKLWYWVQIARAFLPTFLKLLGGGWVLGMATWLASVLREWFQGP